MTMPNMIVGRALRTALMASCAALGMAAWTAPIQAQEAGEAEAEPGPAIVITGSRIVRKDFIATSPIVTVDSDLVEKSSSVNLEANLNKLPQFAPAVTQFISAAGRGDIQANANNTLGATTVALRQLGANRNLVLIDGRRPTPINGTGVVDINTIPSAAVERVEVISGGASSTYGADAVGGVVNFILKRDFKGISLDAQAGVTQGGDGREFRGAGLFGATLEGGRGNVLLGLEYYNREAITVSNNKPYLDLYTDPKTAGNTIFSFEQTYILFASDAERPTQTFMNSFFRAKGAPATATLPNGTVANINIPIASSIYVNTDGSLFLNSSLTAGTTGNTKFVPLSYGYKGSVDGVNRKVDSNGLLRDNYLDQYISTPTERYSFFSRANYDINDDITAFGQASFAKTEVRTRNLVAPAITSWSVIIPHGTGIYTGDTALGIPSSLNTDGTTNAAYRSGGQYGLNCPATGGCTNSQVFPTPAELTNMLDNGRTSPNTPFRINHYLNGVGKRYTINQNTSFQMLAGLEGKIPGTDWTWEVYGSHGETVAKTDQYNFASVLRWRAVAAAPNYGKGFVYKGNSGQPGAGFQGATGRCTSGVNPFTLVTWSEDCRNAVKLDLQNENRVIQDVAEFNLQGGLFELPYGQLRFAVGAAYRKNSLNFKTDSETTEGSSFLEPVNGVYPQGNTSGATKVKEIYGELLIPLLADLPFAHALNLELGYRLSDYSIGTVGTVGTYKINGDWAPISWLRFRGGYQKASRAPNLGELYTAATSTLSTSSDGDPCSRANPANPRGLGNYSANAALNADAAKVEALCRQIMGADGAAVYYIDGRTYSTVTSGLSFPTLTGNAFLKQEDATTYTIGGVITSPMQSPWLRRLSLAVDYYNVKLTNAIAQGGVDAVYRRCFAKAYNPNYELNEFCRLVGRTPGTGEVATVGVTFTNAGQVVTSGVDVQLSWALDLEDAGIGLPGVISTSTQGTYLLEFATTTDQGILPLTDFAGTLGGGDVGTNAGSFRWKLFSTLSYSVGPITASLQWQHKPKTANAALALNNDKTITGAPSYDLFNFSGTVKVVKNATIRYGIDNLFNKRPPVIGVDTDAPAGTLPGGNIDAAQYDVLGRRFYIGAKFDF
jgi:iron complex outermembrane recepter protein